MRHHESVGSMAFARAVVPVLALALVGGPAASAAAWAPGEPYTTWSALAQVSRSTTDLATDLLGEVADVPAGVDGRHVIDAPVGDVRVAIPLDPADPIVLNPDVGSPVGLRLPNGEETGTAKLLAEGVVEYPGWNGSSTVAIVKRGGSVQLASVLPGPDAPRSLPMSFELPAGASFELVEDQSVVIRARDGEYLGGLAPAWAVDAAGMTVPVRYEVQGTRVVLVVEHTAIPAVYPVTAGVWFGLELYDPPRIERLSSGYRVEVTPTPWGLVNTASGMWWAHRDEILTELGGPESRYWTSSMDRQLACLLAGLPGALDAGERPVLRLETWRRVVVTEGQLCTTQNGLPSGSSSTT